MTCMIRDPKESKKKNGKPREGKEENQMDHLVIGGEKYRAYRTPKNAVRVVHPRSGRHYYASQVRARPSENRHAYEKGGNQMRASWIAQLKREKRPTYSDRSPEQEEEEWRACRVDLRDLSALLEECEEKKTEYGEWVRRCDEQNFAVARENEQLRRKIRELQQLQTAFARESKSQTKSQTKSKRQVYGGNKNGGGGKSSGGLERCRRELEDKERELGECEDEVNREAEVYGACRGANESLREENKRLRAEHAEFVAHLQRELGAESGSLGEALEVPAAKLTPLPPSLTKYGKRTR